MNVIVRVNIACAIRRGVASVGIILYWAWLTLYGKNISGMGHVPVGGSHPGPQGSRNPTCGFYILLCKILEQTSS